MQTTMQTAVEHILILLHFNINTEEAPPLHLFFLSNSSSTMHMRIQQGIIIHLIIHVLIHLVHVDTLSMLTFKSITIHSHIINNSHIITPLIVEIDCHPSFIFAFNYTHFPAQVNLPYPTWASESFILSRFGIIALMGDSCYDLHCLVLPLHHLWIINVAHCEDSTHTLAF